MTVILTERAEFRLRLFLQGGEQAAAEKGIRIGIQNGGCSGYQYNLAVADAPQQSDLIEQHGKLRVYIDAASAPLLDGVVLDFVDSLLESGFKFNNPNATDTCGCGQSFTAGECTPAAMPCS